METSATQAEVFDYVKDFNGLLEAAELLLLGYDQIDVHVGMNKVTIGGAPNRSLDAHQAVLLCALEDGLGFQLLGVPRLVDVCAYPADVLAPPESPLFQAVTAHVQSLRRSAP